MTKEECESLFTSVGWQAFKAYLFDVRMSMMEQIVEGGAPPEEAIAKCQILKDMALIGYEDIQRFYEGKNER